MKVTIESAFLKPGENIKDGDLITFLDEGITEPNKQSGKNQMIMTVMTPSMEKKKISVNNTSKSNLKKVYGDESKDWIDQQARVNIVKQMVSNEMKSVIYLTQPGIDLEGNIVD